MHAQIQCFSSLSSCSSTHLPIKAKPSPELLFSVCPRLLKALWYFHPTAAVAHTKVSDASPLAQQDLMMFWLVWCCVYVFWCSINIQWRLISSKGLIFNVVWLQWHIQDSFSLGKKSCLVWILGTVQSNFRDAFDSEKVKIMELHRQNTQEDYFLDFQNVS